MTLLSYAIGGVFIVLVSASPSTASGADLAPTTDLAQNLQSAKSGDAHAMFEVAQQLIATNDTADEAHAFGWALNAARRGHPRAAELTGTLYRLGRGVEQNFIKARKWLFRATGRNAVGAHFELALLFNDRDNPAYDPAEATRHLNDALAKNEPRACLVVASQRLDKGQTVRQNLAELTCAANGGIIPAMVIIAEYYLTTRSPNAEYNARQWLGRAAEAGDTTAKNRLEELDG